MDSANSNRYYYLSFIDKETEALILLTLEHLVNTLSFKIKNF
jgi:hypothetical protein